RALRIGTGARAGLEIDADELDAGRHAERHRRFVGERDLQEVLDDRGRENAAGHAAAERARLVVTDIDAGDDVGRETDEPRILEVVRGAGLAGDRLADLFLEADAAGGAALHNAFHDRHHLIRGHGVEHLLAAIDQRRLRLIIPFLGVAADALALVVLVDGV